MLQKIQQKYLKKEQKILQKQQRIKKLILLH